MTVHKAEGEIMALDRFIRGIEVFRQIAPDMQLQTVLTFLFVAQQDGIAMSDLGERLNMSSGSVSRNVAAWTKWTHRRQPGPGYLRTEEDPMDRRYRFIFLTPEGKIFYHSIKRIIVKDTSTY